MKNKLDRIINLLDRYYKHSSLSKYLNIKEVSFNTSLTIRRAIKSGQLKASRATGKLLFKSEWIEKWLDG